MPPDFLSDYGRSYTELAEGTQPSVVLLNYKLKRVLAWPHHRSPADVNGAEALTEIKLTQEFVFLAFY